MKSIKLLMLSVLFIFAACNDKTREADDMDDTQAQVRDASEAHQQWVDAWKSNDAEQLDTLTASNAILYMQGETMSIDSIKSWYKESAPMMADLQTNSEKSYSGKDVAYEAGTFRHKVKGDSLGTTFEGAYTFIWRRSGNDWKLEVLNIADKTADTTATGNE